MNEIADIDVSKKQKKEFKRTVGHMAWGLIIYSIIGMIISIIGVFVKVTISNPNWINLPDEEIDEIFKTLENQEFFGLLSCAVVFIGIAFLFLHFRKRIDKKQMFSNHKSMNPKAFIQLLCVFLGVQLVAEPIFWLMEKAFNLFGYSVMSSLEEATMGSLTVTMLFYAVILGPVVEEVIYRGFVLCSLKKFGKVYAIIISAFLFGLMHENIPQSVFACMVGVVLGYVTIEYSIWWAVLLHIINNGLSDVLYYLTQNLSVGMQNGIFYTLYGGCFLLGIFFIWKNRGYIHEYYNENKPSRKTFLYTFTTVGIVIFIIMETWLAFSMVDKIG